MSPPPHHPFPPILADSVTRLDDRVRGRVLVTGSHGGVYAAQLAFEAGCRAVIFNNAGIGLDGAGIAGLYRLEAVGVAAAAVDHRTAAIGNAAEMLDRGRISHVNASARACGLVVGQACREAAGRLMAAARPSGTLEKVAETRQVLRPAQARRRLILVDSAALVQPEDADQVVVTGSHGALFGRDVMNALKVDAFVALFNDAGSPGGAGGSRLPALQSRAIAAVTVAAASARIGDAQSTWRDGMISRVNRPAAGLGARPGLSAEEFVDLVLRT